MWTTWNFLFSFFLIQIIQKKSRISIFQSNPLLYLKVKIPLSERVQIGGVVEVEVVFTVGGQNEAGEQEHFEHFATAMKVVHRSVSSK